MLYCFNSYVYKSAKIEKWIWDHLKWELFYISGESQYSGNCCKTIMLYWKKKPIDTLEKFEKAKERNDQYKKFMPVYNSQGKVQCFNCSYLSCDKKCIDYEKRPEWCQTYPVTYFHEHDTLLNGCGYKIERKEGLFKFRNSQLSHRIENIVKNNRE